MSRSDWAGSRQAGPMNGAERYQIDVVDVLKDPASALKHSVLLTPMLIMLKPRLGVSVLGNLSDTKKVLATLRLIGDER